jgi:hypothetical protein
MELGPEALERILSGSVSGIEETCPAYQKERKKERP